MQLMAGVFDFSQHVFRRAIERNNSEVGIKETGFTAIVVEEYPDVKYGPSLLVLGIKESGRTLQAQVSAADRPLVRIITLYEPNPDEWLTTP